MTAVSGFTKAPVQSTAQAGAAFTVQTLELTHTEGIVGSGTLLVCFVGAVDTNVTGTLQAMSATFSGETSQPMNLAHEVTADGRAYPSIHVFTLTEPTFSGIPGTTTGTITIQMGSTASNINAVSICYSGINTTSLGYDPGSFVSQTVSNITTIGAVSGALTTAVSGDLLVDCVVANAGIPDTHTVGGGQTLVEKVNLNEGQSSAMSISHKFKTDLGEGMERKSVTAIESVSSTAFIIYMH